MKNNKIFAISVLIFGIICIIVSLSIMVLKNTNDAPASNPSQNSQSLTTHDTASPTDVSAEDPCAHILSDEWFTENGQHYRKCNVDGCDHTDMRAFCSGGLATCQERALCDVCGTPYGDLADHVWTTEWDYSNADGHAHKCTENTCSQHSELQAHIPGPDATESAPQECIECHYIITPMISHVHSITAVAAKKATCTESGNIGYYTCSNCGKCFTDADASLEITDRTQITISPLEHDFKDATCTSPKTCQRAGCSATEGKPTGHVRQNQILSNADVHWYVCSVCGNEIDLAQHTPNTSASENAAQSCTVCGYVIKSAAEHTHTYDKKLRYDEVHHWYECICGQKKDTYGHTDTNQNNKCDICGYPLKNETDNTTNQFTQEAGKMESILQPAQITLLQPVASGVLTKSVPSSIIDYSNHKDGYIMVKYTESTTEKLKVQVQGPFTTYTYNIDPLAWTVFPLSDGNGQYSIKVFKNVVGNRYSTVLSLTFAAELSDEYAPFLRPNQYVNYENAENTMQKAAELCAGKTDTLEKVKAIYTFIINTITYDYQKAATVQSGYLPDLDQVLADKKGICFDYASLMAGMLRSQNIACKLVVGYANTDYHAWINVWTPDKGWIDGAIFFDGVKWQMMDPTYASSAGSAIINQIAYTSKYIY